MTLPYLPTTGCPAPDLRRPLAELPVAGAESGRYAPSPSREPRDRVRTRRPGRVTPGGGAASRPDHACRPAPWHFGRSVPAPGVPVHARTARRTWTRPRHRG